MNTEPIKNYFNENRSDILFGAGVTSVITAGIIAATSTYKGIIEAGRIKASSHREELTGKEKAKLILKHGTAPVALMSLGVCMLVKSKLDDKNNIAILTNGLLLSEEALRAKDAAIDQQPQKIKDDIRHKEAEVRMNSTNLPSNTPNVGPNPTTLFFESYTGQYFRSDIESVRRAINDFNRDVQNRDYCSFNELLFALGLEQCELGEKFGWSSEDDPIDIERSSHLRNNVEPAMVISYYPHPHYIG